MSSLTSPLVTIVTPFFNASDTIEEAYRSIGKQEHQNWEWIIVDDASSSKHQSALNSFHKDWADPRIQLYQLNHNQGPSAARNVALDHAKGEFIAFLDADDWWLPQHLSHALQIFGDSQGDVVCLAAQVIRQRRGPLDFGATYYLPKESQVRNFPNSLLSKNFLLTDSTIVRKAALQTIRFDESLRYCEDLDFWLRLIQTGAEFVFSAHRTSVYREHWQSATRNMPAVLKSHYLVLTRLRNSSQFDSETLQAAMDRVNIGEFLFILSENPSAAIERVSQVIEERPGRRFLDLVGKAVRILCLAPALAKVAARFILFVHRLSRRL